MRYYKKHDKISNLPDNLELVCNRKDDTSFKKIKNK